MHYCHYVCIVHKENRPESEECTTCIETCLVEEEKTYRHIAGYDKLVESAREKNVGCLKCLYLDVSHCRNRPLHYSMNTNLKHNRIYTTTEVMCGFPHRLENQFPASPEGVEECRKNLLEKATPVSHSDCLPETLELRASSSLLRIQPPTPRISVTIAAFSTTKKHLKLMTV